MYNTRIEYIGQRTYITHTYIYIMYIIRGRSVSRAKSRICLTTAGVYRRYSRNTPPHAAVVTEYIYIYI